MRTLQAVSIFALVAFAAASRAQLAFGSTSTVTTGAYYLDLTTNVAKQIWTGSSSGRKVNGLAADATNGFLYNADAARLSRWSYGTVGTPPTFLTGFYRPTTSITTPTTASGVSALTFAQGNLYAYTNAASTIASAGIYRVDLSVVGSASQANMAPVWTQTNNLQYNFAGIAYDATSGLLYATNTPTSNSPTTPTGLYTINLFASNPTPTKLVDFDSNFLAAPDGLTIGGGKLWMSGKIAGDTALSIESYDLLSGQYVDRLSVNFGDSANFSTDIAWAPDALTLRPTPEPSTWLSLTLGAAALLRRRSRYSDPARDATPKR